MEQDGNDHLLSLSGETVGKWFEVFRLNQPMKDSCRGFYCGGRDHFCFWPANPMCLAGRSMELLFHAQSTQNWKTGPSQCKLMGWLTSCDLQPSAQHRPAGSPLAFLFRNASHQGPTESSRFMSSFVCQLDFDVCGTALTDDCSANVSLKR